jgi:serine-type D-Ala-D-Ala carboxypeptidase (penicillin-binding protein 5/6)
MVLAVGLDYMRSESGSSLEAPDGLSVAGVLSAAEGNPPCVDSCATAGVPLSPAPTPCPYCGQDPDQWRRLTSVQPPELLATSAVLMEADCGEVIFGQNWRERSPPASLAKIATAIVVAENANFADVVDVQIRGWDLVVENGSTIMGLVPGLRLSVEELLYGLLLTSGNDAALELSRYVGGESKTVAMMNERVAGLGLTDTHLQNSHGLDAPGAYTTPFDIAVLGQELLRNPLLRQIVGTQFREETWHDLGGLWNGNYLLYIYEGAIGVKTGFTEEAGSVIVSAAQRDGRELIASVFNSSDVYWDSMRLFDWAFENTESLCKS